MQNAKAAYWSAKGKYVEIRGMKYDPSRYCGKGLPRFQLPPNHYLVHNHVHPTHSLGRNGFRAWVQKGFTHTKLIECTCDFGGLRNNKVNKHHRVIVVPDLLN